MKLSKKGIAELLLKAAAEYIMLKEREKHPGGTFDNAGRFSLEIRCECCVSIRSPSRSYPYSEMVHGRSLKHVAYQFGLEDYTTELRRTVKELANASNPA